LIKNNTEIVNLTTIHKPNLILEKQRIEQNGGEIKRINNKAPFRVYVKGESYPGIAMSRSLGDKISKKIGVCYEPEIKEFDIDDNCNGIVLASDGVWEFVDNECVNKLFNECFFCVNGEKLFVNKLYEIAKKEFVERELSIDDISIIVIMFKNNFSF
jgi:serine/threonine protein phosphatase PrpC